jgi:hypothetical protein
MNITPIDFSYIKKSKTLLEEYNVFQYEKQQVRIGNFLINVHLGARGILVLDDNSRIIDGFVSGIGNYWLYRGISFYDLLGGKDGIANPINFELYCDKIDIYQRHPDSDIWNVDEPTKSI